MKKHIYTCTLLSDVVISQSPATEEKHETLDYIPGSYFLGVAAKKLYDAVDSETALKLFHHGDIHFGDAQICDDHSTKGLKTPLSLHKIKDAPDKIVDFAITERDKSKQYQQQREGYIIGQKLAGHLKKGFALRTAIVNGTAKEGALFGYESLKIGQKFNFEVIGSDDILLEKVREAITGIQHIGRSKSVEYGLVEIQYVEAADALSQKLNKGDVVSVYAEGNLAFFDANGNPTYRPTPEQLGLKSGKIFWDKSFIRTRNFALYNNKRQSRDAHIHAIEKGSIITVEISEDIEIKNDCIGAYKPIGFGKVRYNQKWGSLKKREEEKTSGFIPYSIEVEAPENELQVIKALCKSGKKKLEKSKLKDALKKEGKTPEFKEISSSQWSTIIGFLDRANAESLRDSKINAIDKFRNYVEAFITEGTRKIKWDQTGAGKKFIGVIGDSKNKYPNWDDFYIAMRSFLVKLR